MKKPVMVYRGDTWSRAWNIKTPSGQPVDLTGASARLHLRSSAGVKTLEATTANGLLIITPAEGRIDLEAPAAAMNIAADTYRFDLELTEADGRVTTVELSALVVLEDVSHDD